MKPARQKIFNVLNLHLFGLGLLVILNLALGARAVMAWHTLHAAGPEHLEEEQAAYRSLELQMRPLHGLPGKVEQARQQAEQFYGDRFPGAYSTISSAINGLADKNSVRVTRVSYTRMPAIPGLAEIRMDASLSGEYAPLMHFINGLERSKTFFRVDGLTLTGQQGGLVNLRLRVTTYLHGGDLDRPAPLESNQGSAPGEEDNQ